MDHVSRTLDGRHIDKMSQNELRKELREMIIYAAKLERGAKCFHENVRSAHYVDAGDETQEVTVYTCRQCDHSWSD